MEIDGIELVHLILEVVKDAVYVVKGAHFQRLSRSPRPPA